MARFIEMSRVEGISYQILTSEDLNKIAKEKRDKQMIKKTEELVKETTRLLEGYDFNHVAQKLYDFIWHEFADIYIEDVKTRIDKDSFTVLNGLFLTLLKLLHPFMPFITEEINQRLWGGEEYLIISQWPS